MMRARKVLTYALQPIVNIHTGSVFGYEALLRGFEPLGFTNAAALLAWAAEFGLSESLDAMLSSLAIERFIKQGQVQHYRLFFNLDPHFIDPEHGLRLLDRLSEHGLKAEHLCIELSKQLDLFIHPDCIAMIKGYRRVGLHIAIDDFGDSCSALKHLYEEPPDYIKFDRFFIQGIDTDRRKRNLLANAVQLAHQLNIRTIAKGIETEGEFLICREIGCDLAQGYLIAVPQISPKNLVQLYEHIAMLHERNQRKLSGDRGLIETFLELIPPIHLSDQITRLFDALRRDKHHHIVPVLDSTDYPVGLIYESDIKDYIYSSYGRDLIVNPAFAREIRDFVRPCPCIDIHSSIDRLLQAYSSAADTAGMLITCDSRYHGFISAMSLLRLIEQKNLAVARDQNPLTKLPGNNPIHRYVSQALAEREYTWHLAYMDFDNFKAFNDHYGFRRGDRVIQLFAELLRTGLESHGWFIGHIGGDDFFAGIRDTELTVVLEQLSWLIEKFKADVQSLYDAEDRQRGYLYVKDRYREWREIPLIRCSMALLEIRPGDDYSDGDTIGRTIAELKHAAKQSPLGIALRRNPEGPDHLLTEAVSLAMSSEVQSDYPPG
ncbi:EAL domain-containing protein [Caldichromatium japonicum]|uniref:EAL domain-containing protein n=1 Tax=Caldichromatium japonicum TaxID=2699430 RepID=A0A6G7VGJ8_9GAMM|nr:EAL domain-containing protein [Caldichromatium japonicum]